MGYSKTRWVALMSALKRVLKMFLPLKKYFLSIDKCPNILKEFFENPSSELWLYFMHAQSATFRQAVLKKIEGQKVFAIDAANEINQFLNNLNQKQNACYLPHAIRNIMGKLLKTGAINEENVKATAAVFYKTSKEYLEQWFQFNEEIKIFEWANLRKVPSWEVVQKVQRLTY
jgi:hypothetical protein